MGYLIDQNARISMNNYKIKFFLQDIFSSYPQATFSSQRRLVGIVPNNYGC